MKKLITLSFLAMFFVILTGCNQQKSNTETTSVSDPILQQPNLPAAQQEKLNQSIISDSEIKQTNPSTVEQENINKNLQTYTSNNLGISFQYPKDWYIKEEEEMRSGYRIYIRNFQGDVSRENMPSDFQQIWISTWEQEINAETENNVKNGNPDGREFGGSLSTKTIDRGSFIINTYEYETIGGVTIQAFWTDKSGKRYYATNSTEVGQENQKNMVENLRKILSTVKFTN